MLIVDNSDDEIPEDISDEELKNYFEEKFNQSGFLLENKVEKIAYNEFYGFERNCPYLDKDENTVRTIDFMVSTPCGWMTMKQHEHIVIDLELIIECKQLPHHGWIFSGKESYPSSLEYLILGPKNKKLSDFVSVNDMNMAQVLPFVKKKSLTANTYVERYFKEENKEGKNKPKRRIKTNGKDVNLKDAIMKVTKATRHRVDFIKKKHDSLPRKIKKNPIYYMHIFQPVIIFQGKMYQTVDHDEKSELVPIKFARIKHEYKNDNYDEIEREIHVVSYDGIDDYLNLLKSSFGIQKPPVAFFELFGMSRRGKGFL